MNFNLKDRLYKVNRSLVAVVGVCPCCDGGNFNLSVVGKDGKSRQVICPECEDYGELPLGEAVKYCVDTYELVSKREYLGRAQYQHIHVEDINIVFKFMMVGSILEFEIKGTDTKLPDDVFYTQEEAEEHIRLLKLNEK